MKYIIGVLLFLLVSCSNHTATIKQVVIEDKYTYSGTVLSSTNTMNIHRYFVVVDSNVYYVDAELYERLEQGGTYTVLIIENQDTIVGVQ